MLGYWRSASAQRSGSIFFARTGKLAPVIEVDDQEAAAVVREAYPWNRPTFVRPGEDLSSYWAKPKLAPAVQVDTPQVEARLREEYPYDHPRFFESWKGERAVGALVDLKDDVPAMIFITAGASLIGWMGWKNVKSPWGMMLLGMSGSMLGAMGYETLKKFHR